MLTDTVNKNVFSITKYWNPGSPSPACEPAAQDKVFCSCYLFSLYQCQPLSLHSSNPDEGNKAMHNHSSKACTPRELAAKVRHAFTRPRWETTGLLRSPPGLCSHFFSPSEKIGHIRLVLPPTSLSLKSPLLFFLV